MQDKSHDPKHQRTEAEREALWSGAKIVNVDKTGCAAVVQKKPEYSVASQLIRDRSLKSFRPSIHLLEVEKFLVLSLWNFLNQRA